MKEQILKVLRDKNIDNDVKKEFLRRAPAFIGSQGPAIFGDDNVDYTQPDLSQGREKVYKNEASIVPDASLEEQMALQGSEEEQGPETETKTTQVIPADVSGIKVPDYSKEKKLADESMQRQQKSYDEYGQKMDQYFGDLEQNFGQRAAFGKQEYERQMAEAQEKENLKNKYVMDYQGALDDWNNTKIIPMRALARTSTGMMLGLAVAQAVATVSGDEKTLDRLQKLIDDRIERDIKLQEFEINQKGQKANNILSMMKLVVPEDPSVLKRQAAEVYNNHMIMEAEKLKQRASSEEMKLKLSQLQEGLFQKNNELKLEYDKAAQETINKKAELAYKYGSKVETKVKSGAGAEAVKRTSTDDSKVSGVMDAVKELQNLEKEIAKGKSNWKKGNLPLTKMGHLVGLESDMGQILTRYINAEIKAEKGTQTEGDAKRKRHEILGRATSISGDFLEKMIGAKRKMMVEILESMDQSGKLSKKEKAILKLLKSKIK